MFSEEYILDGGSEFPYKVVAKRYRLKHQTHGMTTDPTLLLVHGLGFHKETWEPTLERLVDRCRNSPVRFREAWAIDCPSHGDSGKPSLCDSVLSI
jgi:pimeloyl-ACP methyl ester carboxylesterase